MFALLLATLGLAGCESTPSPSQTVSPSPSSSPPSEAPARELPSDDELLATQVVTGWSAIPRPPNALAVAEYRRGLTLLAEQDPDAALAAFDKALVSDSNYSWARYGRARALAVLEREREALPELFVLLQEDLPSFAPALANEADLAALRAGPHGELLASTRARIELAYAESLTRGVPAWTYSPRASLSPRTHAAHAPWEDLRLGVFDPQTGHFVPLSPRLPLALGGFIERETGHALLISGEIFEGDMHVVQARGISVHLYDLAKLGTALIDQRHVDDRHPPTQNLRRALAAAIDPLAKPTGNNEGKSEAERARVRLTYFELGYAPVVLSERVAPNFVKVLGQDPAEHIGPARTHLMIDRHGVGVHEPLAGVSLDGARLRIEGRAESIALPARAQLRASRVKIQRSADGRTLMIFAQRARCGERGQDLEHALTRVDLDSGKATLLAREGGLGNAELSPEGWIYYDQGEALSRFAPEASEAQRDLPEHIHLALPPFSTDCGV